MLEYFQHESPFDCVFVHGAGGNNALWKRTLGYLSGRGKGIAINLPGHPTGEITCSSVEEYAEAVRAFISDAGLEKPAVCGHSMGGAVSLALALRYPEAAGGLVLVSTGAKLGVLPEIVDGLSGRPLDVIERTITPLSFFKLDVETAREGRAALSLSNPAVFLNDYLACNSFDVRGKLGRLSASTLIVCGEGDRMTPPKWSHYLNENIASSDAFFIREAGHMVPLEKPALCAGLVQRFLSTLSP